VLLSRAGLAPGTLHAPGAMHSRHHLPQQFIKASSVGQTPRRCSHRLQLVEKRHRALRAVCPSCSEYSSHPVGPDASSPVSAATVSAHVGDRSGPVTRETRTEGSIAAEILVSMLNAFDRSSSAFPAATPPGRSKAVTDTDGRAILVVEGASLRVTRNVETRRGPQQP